MRAGDCLCVRGVAAEANGETSCGCSSGACFSGLAAACEGRSHEVVDQETRAAALPGGLGAASIPAVLRVLLVLMLVHGLVPGLAEIGESVVHYARMGHVAHTSADNGDLGDQGAEHGCGTTQHHCTCCETQAVAPAGDLVVASMDAAASRPFAPRELTIAAREPARPFRPPIS